MVRDVTSIQITLLTLLGLSRLDYPWEALDIHEHDRLAEADKAKK